MHKTIAITGVLLCAALGLGGITVPAFAAENLMQQGTCGASGWGWHGPLTNVKQVGPGKWQATWPHVNDSGKADEGPHTFGIIVQSPTQLHFDEYESHQSYETTKVEKKGDTYFFDGQGLGGDSRFCINGVITLE